MTICLPNNEKYIMFLNPTYFKKRIFKSYAKHYYNKIIKQLENKGIVIFNIKNAIDELKVRHKNTTKFRKTLLNFDDSPFPITNTLYIHLFNNQYYNDIIYNKKKIEVEREMLFLLAGKLGVNYIKYETEVVETTISNINADIKIKNFGPSIKFNKTINKTTGSKGFEEYLNRGAPVYLKSDNLQEVEKNIEDRIGLMQSNIFNYNFYKHSPKLESFVYKRYEFKMQKLDYTIETEDISDISFAVRAYFSYFMNYGLELSFDKNVSYSQNIHYTLEFFTDTELKKEFGKMRRDYMDKFYSVRELYELMDDKDKAVHLISEYVIELANNYFYKLKDSEIKYNFGKDLQKFIINSNDGVFESLCHNFQSTSHIKNWLIRYFLTDEMELIEDNESSILPKPEKIELDKFKRKENIRILDLQHKLELLKNEDITNENITNEDNSKNEDNISQKSSELDINKVIEDCNVIINNNHNDIKVSLSDDDYYERNLYITEDRFANNVCTCVEDNDYKILAPPEEINYNVQSEYFNRPPIIPSNSVSDSSINASINSVFEHDEELPRPPLTPKCLPTSPPNSLTLSDNETNETNA